MSECDFGDEIKKMLSLIDFLVRHRVQCGENFVIIVCLVCLHKVMFFVYWIISLLAQKTLIFENSLILQRKLLNTEDLFMNTIFR